MYAPHFLLQLLIESSKARSTVDLDLNEIEMSFCTLTGKEKYKDHFEAGIYVCSSCGHELFHAKSKYKHHTPWPAFSETMREDSVVKEEETEPQQSSDAPAFKLFCGLCRTGIGHEFVGDGPNGVSRF